MGLSENVGYIPNEIAIFHRDNNQQNHWVQWGTLFSDTPICSIYSMVYGLFCCSWYMFGVKTEYFCTWSICDCWNWKDHRNNFISLWGSFKPFKAWWMRFKDYQLIYPRVLLWILSISISDKEKTPFSHTTNILWFLLLFHVLKTTFNKLPMAGNGQFIPPGGRTVCGESHPAGRESGAIPQRRNEDVRLRWLAARV